MPTPMPDNYVREISLSANATVVRPQYMISQIYQYPAPIHMVRRSRIPNSTCHHAYMVQDSCRL